MPDPNPCEQCGKPVATDAPFGLCPACLLRTAIEDDTSHAPTPLLPKLHYFGDYELLEEIARGGMGVVYRARQLSLQRIVAIKMMRPGLLATNDEIARFQVEARTAASLHHPNIVPIHEIGEFDGLHYFSMDFIEGPSLAALVRQRPLSPIEAAHHIQTLAETVEFAHCRGILHRDLKPSNILCDSSGRPHITDFGLARPIHADASVTLPGAILGTPTYMPPEQASGDRARLGPTADVYSLGAILYELLTGHPPFPGATPLEVMRRVQEAKPATPRTLNPAIPRPLESICLRCLEKDPARRYPSAAALAADVAAFLRGEPVATTRSYRLPIAVASAAVLALIAILAFRSEPIEPPVRPAPPQAAMVPRPSPVLRVEPATPVQPAHNHVKQPPPKAAPLSVNALSITPDHGTGYAQLFHFRFIDPYGAGDINSVEIRFQQDDQACLIFADPIEGRLALQVRPDGAPGLRIGANAGALSVLDNAVCAVDLSGAVFIASGNGLDVAIPLTFKPPFIGPKSIQSLAWGKRAAKPTAAPARGQWTVGSNLNQSSK